DRIPVARRGGNPEHPIQPAQVADHLHVPAVHPEHEATIASKYSEEPHPTSREADGQRRRRPRDAREGPPQADHVWTWWLGGEGVLRHHPRDLAAVADHDRGVEGKPARELGPELRPTDRFPDDKRACGADVDRAEVPQLHGELGRPERPVAADV